MMRFFPFPSARALVTGLFFTMASMVAAQHIVLVGDSTVAPRGGWGPGFAPYLDAPLTCTNLAVNGRSTSSFRKEGRWEEALALKADYYLIQFGHNDEPGKPGRSTTEEEYRANLIAYIDEAQAIGATPILVTPLVRRKFDVPARPGKMVSSLDQRGAIMRELAREKGVPLLELHDRSLALCEALGMEVSQIFSPVKADGTDDTTHLNSLGQKMFGCIVKDELAKAVPTLAPHILHQPQSVEMTGTAEGVQK